MAEEEVRRGEISLKCPIISDLIPLVKDGVASENSRKLVFAHIQECESCKKEYELFHSNGREVVLKDETIIRAMKRTVWFTQLVVLFVGACIGIAFTNSIEMFYNFIIMPCIGVLSYIRLKKKAYLAALVVFILTYVWQTISLLSEASSWDVLILGGAFIYSAIYAALVLFGVAIAFLLGYAFNEKGYKRVISGLIAFLFIGGILSATNAFVGNPISAMLAKKAVERYVQENYHFLHLDLEKPVYNFKDETYVVRATAPHSIDTHFSIAYRDGDVVWDDYNRVIDKFNTLERLAGEYSLIAKKIVKEELGYEDNRTFVLFADEVYENPSEIVQLNMPFTKELPLDVEVTISITEWDQTDISFEDVSDLFIKAHEAFLKENCNFSTYHLYIENRDMFITVNGVKPAQIESGKLALLLKEAVNGEREGISVQIKKMSK